MYHFFQGVIWPLPETTGPCVSLSSEGAHWFSGISILKWPHPLQTEIDLPVASVPQDLVLGTSRPGVSCYLVIGFPRTRAEGRHIQFGFPLIDWFKRNIHSLIPCLNLRLQRFYLQKSRLSYSSSSKQLVWSFSFFFVTLWFLISFTISWGPSEGNGLPLSPSSCLRLTTEFHEARFSSYTSSTLLGQRRR